MGCWSWSSRIMVEQCRIMDIFQMHRDGVFSHGLGGHWILKWGQDPNGNSIGYWVREDYSGLPYLELSYTMTSRHSQESTDLNYRIDIITTPCYFGGIRYWFVCPLIHDGRPCLRRVGKLYLPPYGKYFGCRHCYNLTYRCQKEHDKSYDSFRKNPILMLEKWERRCRRRSLRC